MEKKIIFITGGVRSGKSSFALKEAEKFKGKKAYIATAQALDEEMEQRIEKHKLSRGREWTTFEEPIKIAELIKKIDGEYDIILLDCLTLWLSNAIHKDLELESEVKKIIDALNELKHSTIYIVSNEVGMGIVPENKLARKFRDMAGILNQKIAEISDEVYVLVAGIPLQIKGTPHA
jgi:adenosylcobinamide kinase/adenosylcobinamide-phosphate guanylyltransferase